MSDLFGLLFLAWAFWCAYRIGYECGKQHTHFHKLKRDGEE